MRIEALKIALSFPGCHRRGGVERVFVECLNFLADLGHEVHAFAAEWDRTVLKTSIVCHDVPVHALLPAHRVLQFSQTSASGIMSISPDVFGSFGVAAAPGSIVWMQSVHAAWLDISQKSRGWIGRMRQRINPFHSTILHAERNLLAGRRYRRLVALTPQVRSDLIRFYDVPPSDIDILPNGFSGQEFNLQVRAAKRKEMRATLGYPEDATVLVFVANETARKGLPQLLQAVAALADTTVQVLAVGRFDPRPVASLAASLGLGHRVRCSGASAQVAHFYAAADFFVLPTQYEAWGLVIVEALACGLPVLTSRLAGAAIAVQEGVTGQLLDDPQNVDEIIHKLGLLLSTAYDARAVADSVQQFEWAQILPKYERILVSSIGLPNQ